MIEKIKILLNNFFSIITIKTLYWNITLGIMLYFVLKCILNMLKSQITVINNHHFQSLILYS